MQIAKEFYHSCPGLHKDYLHENRPIYIYTFVGMTKKRLSN